MSDAIEVPVNSLSTKTRHDLRAQAHALKPVVWIAQSSATPGVLREIDRALTAHELIKIHAAIDGRMTREALLVAICSQLAAQPVQVIGKMLIAFRPRPFVAAAADNDRPPKNKAKTRTKTKTLSTRVGQTSTAIKRKIPRPPRKRAR